MSILSMYRTQKSYKNFEFEIEVILIYNIHRYKYYYIEFGYDSNSMMINNKYSQ